MNDKDLEFLSRAIQLSGAGVTSGAGGPFGCVIVKDGKIIGEGSNEVTSSNDPTAHAEVVAIRRACQNLDSFQLTGCTIYASCEPCPMCLGAIYWARPDRVVFANTRQDAAAIAFDDEFIYQELEKDPSLRKIKFEHYPVPGAIKIFEEWKALESKKVY